MADDGPWAALGAVGRAGRVELKIIVPDHCHRTLVAALRGRTRTRRVYYLDTADLRLARRGLVVRARTGGRVDSVVTLRGPRPRGLRRTVRRFPHLTVEVDALPE
ncbi:MAG: adenylate cyclase, partial [Pseudonocardia sp.]|nr:adenylate cyclase [Pseudonocardia sp.]